MKPAVHLSFSSALQRHVPCPPLSDEHRLPPDGKVIVTRTRDGGRSLQVLDRCQAGEQGIS